MRRLALAVFLLLASTASAQIVAGPGWEAFPEVAYLGGDATQPKIVRGFLVLTDSTLELHECVIVPHCVATKKAPAWKPQATYTIKLSAIKEVRSNARSSDASVTEKIIGGALASSSEEVVTLVYESPSNVEAPVFQTPKAYSAALDAKIRFRLKKLGVDIPEKR